MGPDGIIPALVASGGLAKPIFSLCLAFLGGAMTLGAIDSGLHLAPPQWGPLSVSNFYVVRVTALTLVPSPALINGTPSDANGWGLASPLAQALPADGMNSPHTIVDSGTTFTYVPSDTFRALVSAVTAFCGGGPGRCLGQTVSIRSESVCYRIASRADLSTFPALIIELQGGVRVDVSPDRLFINMGWDK